MCVDVNYIHCKVDNWNSRRLEKKVSVIEEFQLLCTQTAEQSRRKKMNYFKKIVNILLKNECNIMLLLSKLIDQKERP